MTPSTFAQWRDVSAWSLRLRLVAIVLVVLTLALTIASAATVAVLRYQLMAQVDRELVNASQTVVVQELREQGRPYGGFNRYDVRIMAHDGMQWVEAPVASVPHKGGPQVGVLADRIEAVQNNGPGPGPGFRLNETVPGVGDDPTQWRVLAIRAPNRRGQPGGPDWLLVSTPLDSTENTIDQTVRLLVFIALVVLATCAMAGIVALRGAFTPLRDIEGVAEAFAEGDTTKRVPPRPSTTEVGRLGGAINSMLDQIETTLAAREASEARMRQFVADASHELRTPLVSVRGFAELYRQGALADEAQVSRAFGRVEDEARRMGGLVEDLLLLARMDEQRPLRIEAVDLCVLAGDLVHDANTLADDRAVTLQGVAGRPPASTVVSGDDARLRQVLTNLMQNAIRYTPAGSPIEVAVGSEQGNAIVQVVDHGPGVPAEDAQRIFGRFIRADVSRQRATGGAGLGLAIVSSIVEAHRGTVCVINTPGGGATFEVKLPMATGELTQRP